MKRDFLHIDYLKTGNIRQREAYVQLTTLGIFEKLKDHDPILTGTIPIGIDLPDSDLDIICHCRDHKAFAGKLTELFSDQPGFDLQHSIINGLPTTIATFHSGPSQSSSYRGGSIETQGFPIEIFGQDRPTREQHAYLHMVIEDRILRKMGTDFRAEILDLKKQGWKTEPAFAKLLGLHGDPFEELLKFEV